MRTEHAEDRRSLALRRSSQLSPNSEDQECLPERSPDIVSRDTSGRLQRDSTDTRAGAADDEVVSITSSTHYPPNRCEATAEVLPLKSQQRDGMLQAKIIPHFEKEEGNRPNRDQRSISPMCHNKHTPKAANNDTGNIPVQSHDKPDTRPMSKKTAAILDIVSEHKIPNASQSVRERTPKDSESKHKMTKTEAISSSTTTQTTSLPGIESFQPDVFIDQKKKHNIQGCSLGIGLRELHETSFRPWFAYRTARCKEVQAQLLSATKDVAQLNTRAEHFSIYEAT
ncbi:hypothetical protein Focb16_v005479 [Fusarium oxysporum f. sp. cubense]|uniref:Uncharacterized protein n=1 Tax=Fusarium oxysporum f. sp. cubense TaxID=61366 RepID=A0A559LIX1_FUSOC|nr:hypothetical protein Focb16_v006145 [Fusarium oxysporum f. sp. cubense]TVY74990.1 hypothetical protein Focb16_v005479 [Fusarium oxysporum f. sp. cubense]